MEVDEGVGGGGSGRGGEGGSGVGESVETAKKNSPEVEAKGKRKMKTPSQLEVLEKTYAIETYPSQGIKSPLLDNQPPVLDNQPPPPAADKPPKTPRQKVVRKAFKGTAHLSNLLPTGSVLTFQFLSPVVTHEGKCKSFVSQTATAAVLAFCAASCFAMSFTDSFRDDRGKVRYGVATFRGIWVVDGSVTLPPEEAVKYRLRIMDFVHAFLSIVIFAAVAMFDKNVIGCFYPSPSEEAREILTALPVTLGVICGLFFVLFPTKRHGVGFPLSRK